MTRFSTLLSTLLLAAAVAVPAAAGEISNGALTVKIGRNGSKITSAVFRGSEFFKHVTVDGPPSPYTPTVSDYGFQIGLDVGTFAICTFDFTTVEPGSESSAGGVVTVTGRYISSVDFGFVRTYSIVPGTNVLRVSSTWKNNTTNNGIPVSVRSLFAFDTFNPDQGTNPKTVNRVFVLPTGSGNAKVAQASETKGPDDLPVGLTVLGGTLDDMANVGFHRSDLSGPQRNGWGGLGMDSSDLFDPNNDYENRWFSMVRGHEFAIDESLSFTFYLAFGDSPAEAQQQFQLAQNRHPLANAGANKTVECTSPSGASVRLEGTGSDPDGDQLTFTWDVPDGIALNDPSSPTPSGMFPIGVTTATLTVTDGKGGIDVDDVVITVVDTHPPEVACSTDTAALYPPNHRVVEVAVFVIATDACTAPSNLRLVSVLVRSNEPDNGLGDGDTAGDVNGQNAFTAAVNITSAFSYNATAEVFEGSVLLRAERDGNGVGRSYSIEATVRDTAGNIAVTSCTSCVVVVPHDRRNR